MDDETWADVLEAMTVEEPAAVTDAATEAAAPEAEPTLTDETAPESVPDAPAAPASVAPAVEPEPASEPEPPYDWRQDPEYQQAAAKARQLDAIRAAAEQAQRIRQQEELQRFAHELADGDAERLNQINAWAATLTTPYQQQVQQARQQVEATAQTASALWLAVEKVLDDEARANVLAAHEHILERLPQVGPFALQELIQEQRAGQRQLNAALSEKDARIADLERQLAARTELAQRQQTGADAVDGGGGTAADLDFRTQLEQAQDFDEYWKLMFSGRAA